MPISFYRRFGLGKVKATTVSLHLADRLIKYPRGVVEDVLIKVDKFFFLVDFIVLDIEDDRNMAVILGRPFLATSRALIDVEKGELILRVQNEGAVFSMYTIPKQPIDLEECFRVDEGVKIGKENYKPDTGGLVAPIKDENGRFKIWRANDKSCKVCNFKQCKTFKDQFKPP
ncbi:Aspartic peptidase domain containing protein [Abeliophyllum distichum]|uniref:Aspartic peptidase domain containing protein n=1 Tax=Abeliophyllum distichum TaxID=126358 RepID=A0ABD1SBQ6_9LAMI